MYTDPSGNFIVAEVIISIITSIIISHLILIMIKEVIREMADFINETAISVYKKSFTLLDAIEIIIAYHKTTLEISKKQQKINANKGIEISTPATPPDDPNNNGTQVNSKTLYNKDNVHIDVENPGNRAGQIHLQKDSIKYYYNIQDQTFRIGSSTGEMAPKAIQQMLNDPHVVQAINKGLKILGY